MSDDAAAGPGRGAGAGRAPSDDDAFDEHDRPLASESKLATDIDDERARRLRQTFSLEAEEPRPKTLKRSKPRAGSSTTGTLYITSTLSVPDLDMLSLGVATVLYCTLDKDPYADNKAPPQFTRSMALFNQMSYRWGSPAPPLPDIPTLFHYVKGIFDLAEFTPECNVLMLVYINRLLAVTKMPLTRCNWRMLVLCACLLAQKVWDDRCLANIDFPVIWERMVPEEAEGSMFDLKAMNTMERHFLELVEYNLSVSAGLYARYYFELRSLAQENRKDVPLKALTKEQAVKLEAASNAWGERLYDVAKAPVPALTAEDVGRERPRGKAVIG